MAAVAFLLAIATFAWWKRRGKSAEASAPAQPTQDTKADPQARHLKKTIEFAKARQQALRSSREKRAAWERRFAEANACDLDKLSGQEFEEFLAGLFRGFGYSAELTAPCGDYGADLILIKAGRRIAVQAKRYRGSVGVLAVQEVLAGQSYYRCDTGWVVTTGRFTPNALELADKSGVKMIGRNDLGNLMAQQGKRNGHG